MCVCVGYDSMLIIAEFDLRQVDLKFKTGLHHRRTLKSKMKRCKESRSQEWRDISYRNSRLKGGSPRGNVQNVCKHFREKDQG